MDALSTASPAPASSGPTVLTEPALEALETEITELWGHINAALYRFFELVAEFDRNEGWARHGAANCA